MSAEYIGALFLWVLCVGTWMKRGRGFTVFWFSLYGLICTFVLAIGLFFLLSDLHHAGDSPSFPKGLGILRDILALAQIPSSLAAVVFFFKGVTRVCSDFSRRLNYMKRTIIFTMLIVAFGLIRDICLVMGSAMQVAYLGDQMKPAGFLFIWSVVFLLKQKRILGLPKPHAEP